MSKKAEAQGIPDMTKKAQGITGGEEYQRVASGSFAPMWKPENAGETVDFFPNLIKMITTKAPKAKKGKKQEEDKNNPSLEIRIVNAEGCHFSTGEKTEEEMHAGDEGVIPLSSGLVSEDGTNPFKLAFGSGDEFDLSPLCKKSIEMKIPIRVVFRGKAKLAGGHTFKRFDILATATLAEAIRSAM